jgi:hypothetical protein
MPGLLSKVLAPVEKQEEAAKHLRLEVRGAGGQWSLESCFGVRIERHQWKDTESSERVTSLSLLVPPTSGSCKGFS